MEERIADLNSHFTRVVFESICRSLFSDHALAFAFALCVGILRGGNGHDGGRGGRRRESRASVGSEGSRRGSFEGFDEDVWSFVLTGELFSILTHRACLCLPEIKTKCPN